MRARPGLPAFGLRSRIVGAVLVTAVATLVVAAIALLGPLEQSLRNAAMKTLQADLHGAVTDFAGLEYSQLPVSHDARLDLLHAQQQLAERIGAIDAVLGYPDAAGQGEFLLAPSAEGRIQSDRRDDVPAAFHSGRKQYTFGSIDGTEYARAAIPFNSGGLRYVLIVRKPIDTIPRAASTVRTAFLTAALVALALTLIIGIPLSARIVRRLRRLRQAALQVAQEGPAAVEVPEDQSRDEVGDLSRTFALMQQQLLRQEEARRAFVATASHELRTPLATLDGMLELLHEDLRSDSLDLDDAESLLERARVQSRRLGRLAADLLDLSRIDAQVELRSEPVELGELSRAVLAEFDLGTSERRIATSLDDTAGSVWALGDPGSVARILRILLDNALRHSPDGGEVRVELRNGSQAALSVADQGPGVPQEERALIFERFQRGRQTSGQAGFGLGLAIGRELATRMGGELVLEPDGGSGARFTLRLPAARAPEEEPVAVA